MAAPMSVSASTWNCLKTSNLAFFPELFSSIVEERQALSCQASGFSPGIVSHINTCLSSSATRLEGLFLLHHFINQCSSETLSGAALSWLGQLTTILQSYEAVVVHQTTCRVIAAILTEIRPLTELSHEASMSHVPQVILALLGAKEQWNISAVQCLISCMENFAGPCGPFKDKIERFILPLITEVVDKQTWQIVSKCYALLPTCGGGGHQSVKHIEAWDYHFNMLLGSLQVTLTSLYQGLEEDEDIPSPKNILKGLEAIDEADDDRYYKLTNRFLAVGDCLVQMLSTEYSFVVKIPVKGVLNFVCRTLAINEKFLESRPSTDRLLLATVIGRIHQSALTILETLVHSCKTILLPHSNVVSKLLLQTLSWTNTPDISVHCKPYSSLRQLVYNTLLMWLKACGGMPSIDSLTQSILTDVKPGVDSLKLDSKQSKLHDTSELISSKKRKKNKKGAVSSIGTTAKLVQKGDPDLSLTALNALKQLLLTSGHNLKTRTLQNIEEFLVPQLLQIQNGNIPPPYNESACHMSLYCMLHAMVLVSHPTWQSSVPCAIRLFSAGQRESNIEISSFAMESLAMCTALIHPRVPALYRIPVRDTAVTVTSTDVGKDATQASTNLFLNSTAVSQSSFGSGIMKTTFGSSDFGRTEVEGAGNNRVTSGAGSSKESDNLHETSKVAIEEDFGSAENGSDHIERMESNEASDSEEDGDDDDDDVEDEMSGNLMREGVEVKRSGAEAQSKVLGSSDLPERRKIQTEDDVVSLKKRKLESAESLPSVQIDEKSSSSSPQPGTSELLNNGDGTPSGVVDSMLMSFVDAGPDSE